MRKWIGDKIQDKHSKIDDEFFDNPNPKDEDYKKFWRGLGYGVHPELEASCSRYAKLKSWDDDKLYFWYKWSMYYRQWVKIKFARLIGELVAFLSIR